MKRFLSVFVLLSIVLLVMGLRPASALPNIYDFATASGLGPQPKLVQGRDGSFYGTTVGGGIGNNGTVFKVTADGTLTTLVNFNLANGAHPWASLIQGGDGSFYGTTTYGGGTTTGGGSSGSGTVFKVTTDGTLAGTTLTTLVNFTGANGATPYAALVQGSDGNFYGTTSQGGSSGNGTVFKVTADGTLTTLVNFNLANGAYPHAPLVQGSDGGFYGTTAGNGSGNNGTVFKVTADGTLTTLVNFTGANGANPNAALVQGGDGSFYGTTTYGGGTTAGGGSSGNGTVFKVTTDGTLTTLVNFTGANGANPNAALVQGSDGSFYGTTTYGGGTTTEGGSSGNGTVFKVTTSGTLAGTTLTTLVNFTGANGANPYAALVQGRDGSFYGTTAGGGSSGNGTVFDMTTDGTFAGTTLTTLVNFINASGAGPYASLVQGGDGSFYGTTIESGSGNYGTVFKVTTDGTLAGTTLTTLVNFTGANGATPYASLIQGGDGSFYGTTTGGGSSGNGTVFKVTTDGTLAGTTLTTLVNFTGANGATPYASLIQGGDGSFYGTTFKGGSGSGTVFKVTTDGTLAGTTLTTLVNFTGANGANPQAALVQGSDGSFYGTTFQGGTTYEDGSSGGTVFKVTTNGTLAGTTLTTLVKFNVANGANPWASLIQGSDGSFYGTTTYRGGSGNNGTVFKVTAAGILTTLVNFTAGFGNSAWGSLTQGRDGSFYGTTLGGGSSSRGTVFKVTTDGTLAGTTLTTLVNLTDATGTYTYASLIQGSDGSFYGTASLGGSSNFGTVLRVGRPTVRTSSAGTLQNQPVTLSLPFNDPDGDSAPLSFSLGTALHGTLTSAAISLYNPGTGEGVVTVTYTPSANYSGPDSFNYAVGNAFGASNTAPVNLAVSASPLYQINCGGGDYTSPTTGLWKADAGFTGGATWSFSGLNITGTADPELYRDVRYGTVGRPFGYALPAAPGSYTLKLHFVEGDGHAAAPGFRTFNVLVNGTTALSGLDVCAAAGGLGRALVESLPVTVSSGGSGVTVSFETLTYSAMVSAIELIPSGPPVVTTPALPPAPTNLKATAGNGQVSLSWDSVAGATSYNVYRSTTSGPPYTPVSPAGTVTGTSFTDASLSNGTLYYYVVTATGPGGEGANSNEANATPEAPETTPAPALRINAGGGSYTSPTTGLWKADAGFTGGATWSFSGLNITGTADPELYRDVRYGTVGRPFGYALPAAPGSYTLKLHFVEGDGHAAAPGFRTFNVLVNGTTALSGLDVCAAAGGLGRALVESLPVTVSSGGSGVTVSFETLTYSAMVSAIELVPAS